MTKRSKHQARMRALREEAQRVVQTGRCPECGAPLVRNLALAGWWQCCCKGEPGFRGCDREPSLARYKSQPRCEFECFVE